MAFFGIQSLFTNIPFHETIDLFVNRVFQHQNKKIKGVLMRRFKQIFEHWL